MICYIPGCICYGPENFGLGSLRDDYVGLAGATPQLYSVAPYTFDYRFVDESLQIHGIFYPINQLISFVFNFLFIYLFVYFAICSFQFNLQSKCSPSILLLLFQV